MQARIAQSVEQQTENLCVGGSIPPPGTTHFLMIDKSFDINSSCFVFASAGSGKTKLLVDRYIKSLLYGIKPTEILCLTFTNLAVNEMHDRILKLLEKLKAETNDQVKLYLSNELKINNPDNVQIRKAKCLYDIFIQDTAKLKIQTIHGFCQSVLSEFPFEAGLSPGFRTIDTDDLRLLIKKAKYNYFSDSEHEKDADDVISQLSGYSVNEFLESIFTNSTRYLHFYKLNPDLNEYRQKLIKQFKLSDDIKLTDEQQRLVDEFFPKITNLTEIFLTKAGGIRKRLPFPDDKINITKSIAETVYLNYQNSCRKKLIDRTISFLKVTHGIFKELEKLKNEQQTLDFNDVLEKTYYLLFHSSSRDYVLSYIAKQIKTILLDEAQDLSSVQWMIIGIIAECLLTDRFRNNTIFVVGDIKQSIYRFQNARHELLTEFCRYVDTTLKRLNKQFDIVYLDRCYRTTPDILKNVDAVFDKYGKFAFGQQYRKHISVRNDKGIFKLVEMSQPSEIANYIKVNDIKNGMILIRGKTELSTQLYYELINRNVKVAPLDKIYLKDTLIVQDIVSLTHIAIDDTDDFEVSCILRSPNVFHKYLSKKELHDLCYMRDATILNELSKKYHEKYKVFKDIIELYKTDNLVEFFYHIVSKVMLTHNTNEDMILESFIDIVLNYDTNYGGTIPEFLEYLTNSTQTVNITTSTDNLKFSTIHGSKGLEADNVILLDFKLAPDKNKIKFVWKDKTDIFGNTTPEENLFFLKPSVNETFPEIEDIINTEYEEETMELYRLLYVALTRPRNNIYIFGNPNNNSAYKAIFEVVINNENSFSK